MAVTLTTNWQVVASYRFAPSTGFICDFYLDAKYSAQSIANNQTTIQTRLRSNVVAGSGSGNGYSFTLDYASTVSGSTIWYLGTETISTGNGNVTHNSNGTKTVTLHASAYVGYIGLNASFSGDAILPTIPRYSVMSSADNFNDENNPKITFSNPSGGYFSLRAKIEAGGNTQLITRDLSKTATSYRFNLTDAERNKLRDLCKNSNSLSVRFTICCMNGNTELSSSYLDRTMTIVNGNPTFNDFIYKDTNTNVTAVTGNNQVLVKGLSTLQATISSANKMVANKKATAKNYVATIDNINKSVDYSTSDLNINLGAITSSGTKRLNIRAYDSRNNSTLVYKDITVYDYDKPVINASVTRLNNFENQTTLKVSGTYSKLTINNTDKNKVKTLQYRYRESGGTWSSWKTLTSTIADGKFTCTDVILSLDNTKAFDFEVQVIDNLQASTLSLKIDIGQAIFFISSNKKSCYINGQEILTYDVIDQW